MKFGPLKDFIQARRTVVVCLALVLGTALVYWRVSRFDFLNFDDQHYVYENPYVTGGLSAESVSWAFTTSFHDFWHPLTWCSHMLDCELFGVHAGMHHLMNVGFHALNTLLLFLLLLRMTGAFWRSAVVAALFALHPTHVESVAWVAERKDVLSGLFFFLTLGAYVEYSDVPGLRCQVSGAEAEELKVQSSKFKVQSSQLKGNVRGPMETREGTSNVQRPTSNVELGPAGSTLDVGRWMFDVRLWRRSFWYACALACFALGLMSKPMLVTLPFVLVLLDYWPLGRVQSPTSNVQSRGTEVSSFKFQVSSLQAGGTTGDCGAAKTDHASRSSHQIPHSPTHSPFPLPPLLEKLPFLFLALASAIVTYAGMKVGRHLQTSEETPWGLRWANVPVSYVRYLGELFWPHDLAILYPLPKHWEVWQVAGAVAVLLLVSWFVLTRRRSAPYLVIGWLVFLGMLTPVMGIISNGFQSIADRYLYLPSIGIFIAIVWGVAETFKVQSSQKEVAGSKFQLPSSEAGGTTGECAAAKTDHASRITHHTALALAAALLTTLGLLTWHQLGYWRDSLTVWSRCLAVTRDNVIAHYNLGFALQAAGRTTEGIEEYRQALKINPEDPISNVNLGAVLQEAGRPQEATNYLAKAVRLKPGEAKAQEDLGLALLDLGDFAAAAPHCAEAIRLDPKSARGLTAMGRAASGLGKSDEALRYYSEALALNPSDAQTHYHLGLEWMKRGVSGLAASSFEQATHLAPDWPEAQTQLAAARRAQKEGK
jgi:tetratricopeptide (TPR) repeat protein